MLWPLTAHWHCIELEEAIKPLEPRFSCILGTFLQLRLVEFLRSFKSESSCFELTRRSQLKYTVASQCARMDLNKRFLPKPMTITG